MCGNSCRLGMILRGYEHLSFVTLNCREFVRGMLFAVPVVCSIPVEPELGEICRVARITGIRGRAFALRVRRTHW